jgi:uncharacterized protein YegL
VTDELSQDAPAEPGPEPMFDAPVAAAEESKEKPRGVGWSETRKRKSSRGTEAPGERDSRHVPRAPRVTRPVAAPAMKAGRHDDNKQYNRFLQFLGNNEHLVIYGADIRERLVIELRDKNGRSLPNCTVEVKANDGRRLSRTVTYADGRTLFFPSDAARNNDRDFQVRAACGSEIRNGQLRRDGKRKTELHFPSARTVNKPLPVDIAIVLDTSGSMQSQIDRLKKTLQAVHFQLTNLPNHPDIRFGLVAYRDRGDEYVTRVTAFERDVREFQAVLDRLDADGGGDTPEDLQQALADAMHELDWRQEALRLGFIVSDAIPHTDYGQEYTYESAMREALARGIKWTTVGAGGLGRDGEVIFRQIAQFSMGEYVFITQGGGGDAEGGTGEASHHVGSNYSTENLDQAIVRIAKREISYLTDDPRDFDDTIVATATRTGLPRDKVLAPAVNEVLRQLHDYSSIRLERGTPVAVVPVDATDEAYADVAEYLSEQLVFAASRNRSFRVLERDMSQVGQELELQISDMFDVENTVQVGKLIGAELLIVAQLRVHKSGATLFAKMVRVETGEMLSVAKVDMDAYVLKSS